MKNGTADTAGVSDARIVPKVTRPDIFSGRIYQTCAAFLSLCLMVAVLSLPVLLLLAAKKEGGLAGALSGDQLLAFLGAIIAMFGILMTGIFVFMTLRIDRGARAEARAEAQQAVEETLAGVRSEAAAAASNARKDVDAALATVNEKANGAVLKVGEAVNGVDREVEKQMQLGLSRLTTAAAQMEDDARRDGRDTEVPYYRTIKDTMTRALGDTLAVNPEKTNSS